MEIDHSLDHESKSDVMMALPIALGSLCTLLVIGRIYTRLKLTRNAGSDDVMIVITQVLATGLNIATCMEAHYGVGRHIWLQSHDQAMRQLKCLFAAIHFYIWSLCFVKVSLLLQYRRLFPSVWLQRVSLGIIIFACTWNVAQSVVVSFACVPVSLIYPSMAGRCPDSLPIWYTAAAMNIATDFIVFALPIPLINSLLLPMKQKILLILIFGLGFFTCIISIVRATTLHLVVDTNDPSWYGFGPAVWSMVEVNCAILCACLPTIRHMLVPLIPWLGMGQMSKYGTRDPLNSKSTRRKSAMQQQRAMNQTIGGTDDPDAVMVQTFQEPPPMSNDLETRWGIDFEKPGIYYHSNQISAWIGACPGENQLSPTESRPKSMDDGGDEQDLVRDRSSEADLGQHILITKETVVKEGRADDPNPMCLNQNGHPAHL